MLHRKTILFSGEYHFCKTAENKSHKMNMVVVKRLKKNNTKMDIVGDRLYSTDIFDNKREISSMEAEEAENVNIHQRIVTTGALFCFLLTQNFRRPACG